MRRKWAPGGYRMLRIGHFLRDNPGRGTPQGADGITGRTGTRRPGPSRGGRGRPAAASGPAAGRAGAGAGTTGNVGSQGKGIIRLTEQQWMR